MDVNVMSIVRLVVIIFISRWDSGFRTLKYLQSTYILWWFTKSKFCNFRKCKRNHWPLLICTLRVKELITLGAYLLFPQSTEFRNLLQLEM